MRRISTLVSSPGSDTTGQHVVSNQQRSFRLTSPEFDWPENCNSKSAFVYSLFDPLLISPDEVLTGVAPRAAAGQACLLPESLLRVVNARTWLHGTGSTAAQFEAYEQLFLVLVTHETTS